MIDKTKIRKAEDLLEDYRGRFEEFLIDYLNEKVTVLKEIEPLGEEAGRLIEEFVLNGGKRIRAALVYFGYRTAGGNGNSNIAFASASIELLHSYFLIHDDIIDKSDLRRGLPTIHTKYQQMYREKGLISNSPSNGKTDIPYAMAIINGDMCCALAYEALVESGFQANKIVKVLKIMHETAKFSAVGELVDIVETISNKATEERILRMHYLKTAKYTVEAPLLIGAILQGASPRVIDSLSKYAIPVGVAFQVHDDILGVFGEEGRLGKSVSSDIQEGKQTLLTVKAIEKASPQQKKKLEFFMGNPNTKIDMDEVRKIIEDTGALEYSKEKEISLSEQGKKALIDAPIQEDIKDILLGFADLLIEREY
ncbi:polyprenyl synthetase family protein [Chloroflexota bacterium]